MHSIMKVQSSESPKKPVELFENHSNDPLNDIPNQCDLNRPRSSENDDIACHENSRMHQLEPQNWGVRAFVLLLFSSAVWASTRNLCQQNKLRGLKGARHDARWTRKAIALLPQFLRPTSLQRQKFSRGPSQKITSLQRFYRLSSICSINEVSLDRRGRLHLNRILLYLLWALSYPTRE